MLCLLAPAPLFHTFFRCLEILHHLLAADGYVASYTPLDVPAPPRELPAELPTDSQAAAFLAALRETLSGSLAAGAVVSVALPPRADYKLSPLPTIATDVPSQDGSELPPRLAAGEDFAELQVPPSATGAWLPLRAPARLLASTARWTVWRYWRSSRGAGRWGERAVTARRVHR